MLMLPMLVVAGCFRDGLATSGGPSPYEDGTGFGSGSSGGSGGSGYGGDVDGAVWPDPGDTDSGPPSFPLPDDAGPWPGHDAAAPSDDAGAGGGTRSDGCTLRAYYMDADGDGFGDPTSAVLGCAPPVGHVTNSLDCYDLSALAHPGQASFFTVERGDGSFDYDCDAQATKELSHTDPKICECAAGTCSVSSGYRVAVPGCGVAGDFAIGGEQDTCDVAVVSVVEPCR